MLPYEVHIRGLVQRGDLTDSVIQEFNAGVEAVPEDPAHPDGDIDPRPPEFLERENAEGPDLAVGPDRFDPDEGEDLRELLASVG